MSSIITFCGLQNKKNMIERKCKIYSTKASASTLDKNNIKIAELIFNYTFKYVNTTKQTNLHDMGSFLNHFSDIQIRNKDELYSFLSETLDWGTDFF